MIYQIHFPVHPAAADQSARPIRLVQCSDMHLFANPSDQLLGLNTQHSFEAVVELIKQQQPHIDLLLTTGDIAQQAATETYQRFLACIGQIDAPHFSTPGNHDLDQFYQASMNMNQLPCEIIIGNWCCILLDSTVDYEIAGSFSPSTLKYLTQALQRQHDKYILIALHHNPIAVGCTWLDQHMLKTCQAFFDIIESHSNVRLVIHGHVHQDFEQIRQGVLYLATPSTSLQFKPNSEKFTLDTQNPGYRWLDLYADGRMETGIARILKDNFSIDFQSDGY